jgi:hypothetical protein
MTTSKEHAMTTPTTTYDFGFGPIPAHRHPDGGWVPDTVQGVLYNACLLGTYAGAEQTEATVRLCRSKIEEAVEDMDFARRTIKAQAAQVQRYAEDSVYEVDKGLHPSAVGWVQHHAEKMAKAQRDLQAATKTVRTHALILSTLIPNVDAAFQNMVMNEIVDAAIAGRLDTVPGV